MNYKRYVGLLTAVSIVCGLLAGCGTKPEPADGPGTGDSSSQSSGAPAPTAREALEKKDFYYVTEAANLAPDARKLAVTRPSKEIITTADSYFITGTSDPARELACNGTVVEKRGEAGSFGLYVELEEGENSYAFTQGEAAQTVVITRDSGYQNAVTVREITSTWPDSDRVVPAGEPVTLTCDAPSGASVTARIGGGELEMTQLHATAVKGVPATFTAEFTPPNASGVVELGKVDYLLSYGNSTSKYSSEGRIFTASKGSPLVVRVKDTSATLFAEDDNGSDFIGTAKLGAVDTVTEIGEPHPGGNGWTDMYRLSMGGWVAKKTVEPVAGMSSVRNTVTETGFTAEEGGERFTLKGSANPIFTASQKGARVSLSFAHTDGVGEVPAEGSKLFTEVRVKEEGGYTTLTFVPQDVATLWGYVVEYDEGNTSIYFKYAPAPDETGPLGGIVIAVDPGHGGDDIGTAGVSDPGGITEKDVTYATAAALERRLTALGAKVLMLRGEDDNPTLNERMQRAQDAKADLFLSLHCNSIGYELDGTGAGGVEVYYYEEGSQFLAETVLRRISEATGRYARGAYRSNYKVTLNSYAPSVLIEMGFLTSPKEFDDMCSKQGIFELVNALSDSILEEFGVEIPQ